MAVRLNHRQLEAFRAVMTAGLVTRAAELLRISQPAVTRLIGDLEHAVGFPLFERRKGRLVPTVEGRVFYKSVERSFVGIHEIAQIADDIRRFNRGSLDIAGMPAMALEFLPRLIKRFLDARPGIHVSLQVRSSQKVLEWMASQHLDVGFAATHAAHPGVDVETLVSTRLVCVLPKGHRLARRSVIRARDLGNESFVSLGPELGVRFLIDTVFDEAEVARKLNIDTQLSASACALVLAGAGVSLVDPITAAEYLDRGIIATPFEPEIPFTYSVIYPSFRPRARVATAFVELVVKALRDNPLVET